MGAQGDKKRVLDALELQSQPPNMGLNLGPLHEQRVLLTAGHLSSSLGKASHHSESPVSCALLEILSESNKSIVLILSSLIALSLIQK